MTSTHIDPALMARMLRTAGLYNLPAGGLQTLCELAATGCDSLTMSSMARKLGVSTAAITGTADALEALGFVTRQHSRTDRRVIWLNLTDRGRAALEDILNA